MSFDIFAWGVAREAAKADPAVAALVGAIAQAQALIDDEVERKSPPALINRLAQEGMVKAHDTYATAAAAQQARLSTARNERAAAVSQAAQPGDSTKQLVAQNNLDADFQGLNTERLQVIAQNLSPADADVVTPYFYKKLAAELRSRGTPESAVSADSVREVMARDNIDSPELRDPGVQQLDLNLQRGTRAATGQWGAELEGGVHYFPHEVLFRLDKEPSPTEVPQATVPQTA